MKKLIIAIMAIATIACSKEKSVMDEVNSASAKKQDQQSTTLIKEQGGILASAAGDGSASCGTVPNVVTYANGMLCFPNSLAFRMTYASLECQVENYTGYNQYMSYFNGDLYKIDSMLDAMGIDEDKSLINFENKFPGYSSLRKKLDADEETFLAAGGDPGASANPVWNSASDDVVFNSLQNANGCFKIGDTIVKIFPNGVSYLITDGNMSTLAQITDYYSTNIFTAPNVIVLWNEDNTGGLLPCDVKLNWRTHDPEPFNYSYSGKNYKFKTTIKVTNVPFFHAYTALSRNYVRKNNRWKKSRMNLYANAQQAYKTCRRIDGVNVRFPNSGYRYKKHVRAIYKSNIFHIFNNGYSTNGNTLYIAAERNNLRAINGVKYGSNSTTRTVIISW